MEDLVDQTNLRPPEPEDELVLPAGATSLTFLQRLYRDHRQSVGMRLRAAIAAAPYHPRLSMTAVVTPNEEFVKRLELCWERSSRVMLEPPAPLKTDLRLPPTRLRRI
jgi:hypothetical protein